MAEVHPVVKTVGGDQTSYTSPGKEITDYYKGDGEKPPAVDKLIADPQFINAVIALSDAMPMDYHDAVIAVLVAEVSKQSKFDFGMMAQDLKKVKDIGGTTLSKDFNEINKAMEKLWHNVKGGKGEVKESIEQQISSMVQSLMEGKKDKAKKSLKDILVRLHAGDDEAGFVKAKHQCFMTELRQTCFWKEYTRENSPKIKAFVRGDLNEINDSGIRPKFRRVRVEGDPKIAGQYNAEIKKSLEEIGKRFERMRDSILEASRDQWLVNSLSSYDAKYGHQTTSFMNQYVGELLNSLTTVTEGVKLVSGESDLPFQALLYDTLAEEYSVYALAYLFAKKALSDIKSGV
jgi:hypothetical protein